MKSRNVLLVASLLLAMSNVALGADLLVTDKFTKELTLGIGGSVLVENAFGNIEIVGADVPGIRITAQKIVRSATRAGIEEGRTQTDVALGGDGNFRIIRTVLPIIRPATWSSIVNYTIRVPRTVHVRVNTNTSERLHITNIAGNVFVKNFSGMIVLERVTGATTVESINGHILFDSPDKNIANVALSTVNGNIEIRVVPESNLRWIAQTIRGDYRTTLPVRGRFDGTSFRGTVNSPEGPTLTTASMTGNTFLLARGTVAGTAQSLKTKTSNISVAMPAPTVARTIRQALVSGSFTYETSIGNIAIGEVRGNADVRTGAGEVQLGSVLGRCTVNSFGGPLNLGDIFGPLNARTDAGDVLVQAARDGGTIVTGGGTIRLLYNAGPMRLNSGGGDIIVRQAAGPIDAETRSGDVILTVSPNMKTLRAAARTYNGNINFITSPGFAADLDVTILTDKPETHILRSDFRGLTIKRDQVGTKTRIHATGKVNGGGERVVLTVEQGGIQLTTTNSVPVTVIEPR